MSSAVLVRVCVMLVSHRIASVQNSEIEMSEENLFEGVLVSLSGCGTQICKTKLHQFVRSTRSKRFLDVYCGEVRDIYSLNERIPSARECVCTYAHMYFLDGRPKTYPGIMIGVVRSRIWLVMDMDRDFWLWLWQRERKFSSLGYGIQDI